MGFRWLLSRDLARAILVSKFRRRFANLLIAVGLVYIGMAIGASQSLPLPATTRQFTVSPVSNTSLESPKTEGITKDAAFTQNPTSEAKTDVLQSPADIPQCSYRPIPYKTIYKSASWLSAGQTITTGGMDGEEKICSSASGTTAATIISPLDQTVTTGTYVSASINPADPGTDNNSPSN